MRPELSAYRRKSAVTVRAWSIVTTQVVDDVHPGAPLHELRWLPAAGTAVSVTSVPEA